LAESYSVEAFLKANVGNFKKGMSDAEKSVDGLEKKTQGFTDGFKTAMVAAAAAAGAAAMAFGALGIQSAADMQAMDAQFTQVFGDMEGQAQQSVDRMGKEFDMVPNRLKPALSMATSQFKGLGLSTEEAMKQAETAVTMTADAAAFYDRSFEEANAALNSFIKGNYEGGEAIGLFANETQMATWASENLGVEWKTLDEAGKQVARLEFAQAMQESAGATGQAARESDSLSNQLGNVKSAFSEFAGTVMQPMLDPLINGLKSATQWLTSATGGVKGFQAGWNTFKEMLPFISVGLATLAAALITYNFAAIKAAFTTNILANATRLFAVTVGFLTSPITLIIVAIGALVAAMIYLYNHNEKVRNAINTAWSFIKNIVTQVVSAVSSFVKSVWGSLTSWWSENNGLMKKTAETIWNAISKVIQVVMNFLKPFIESAWNKISTVITAVWNLITTIVQTGINLVLSIITAVMQAITGDWEGAWNTISSALEEVWTGMISAIDSFLGDIASSIGDGMSEAYETVTGWISDFYDAGANIVGSIADGISSAVGSVTGAIEGVVSKVRGFLPFSPAKEGPLDDIHRLNFGGPIEDSINRATGGVQNKLAQMLALPAMQPLDIAGSVQQISAQAQRKLNFNGSMQFGRQPIIVNVYDNKEAVRAYVNEENALDATIRRF
jgi:predicted PurR-regulated permease PerM